MDILPNTKFMPYEYHMKIKEPREIIRFKVHHILSKIEEKEELISIIFLILDESILPIHGFNLINEVMCGNIDRVSDFIMKDSLKYLGPLECAFDPLLEAIYVIGRYDILETDLGLCLEHDQDVLQSLHSLSCDRLALYHVFSGLTQDEADKLIFMSFQHWQHFLGDSFEMTFLKNLNSNNYVTLITDIYKALYQANYFNLAHLIQPYSNFTFSPECAEDDSRNTENAYTEFDLEFYPRPKMEPYGLCVIFNVKNFIEPMGPEDDISLEVRRGSDTDKYRLEGTFKLFGFNVIHLNDPTYKDVNEFFAKIRRDGRLFNISCLAVCVMTHGDRDDNLYFSDRASISVNDLRKLCYSTALIGKPKLYFVQACRGDGNLRPMFLQSDTTAVPSNSETDCLICAATVQGYAAMRSQSSGSWFITDLCTTLQEIGHLRPLKEVLRKTRTKLTQRVDKYKGSYITQTSEDKDTLTKEVQFLRGSEESFTEGIVDLCIVEILDMLFEDVVNEACYPSDCGNN